MTNTQAAQIAVLYKRDGQPDQELVHYLENELGSQGHTLFIDRFLTMGVDWAREIETRIRSADAVIPLLSADSIHSEMLGFELEIAHEASQLQSGKPRLLPVRLNYTGPLPEPMASILDPIQYFLWEGPNDNLGLITELGEALKHMPAVVAEEPSRAAAVVPPPGMPAHQKTPGGSTRPLALEAIGGAVPLDSEFYLARPVDADLYSAISKRDSIILIKGARQMGKTSLLARGLQHARAQGIRAVSTDLQKFNAESFQSVNHLYLALAESMADQLELNVEPADFWEARRGPNANFERFVRRAILAPLRTALAWGLDEVDRLFVTPYGSEFFGLLRSWHNERALDPTGPWSALTIAIAFATEAHLFITDMNQSPFNVGTRLALEDFTPVQVTELNRKYGNPIKSSEDLNRFYRLVGGQPYLVRRGLHELATRKMPFDAFEEIAARDEGFYGDHLRRILVSLARDPALAKIMHGILGGQPCPTSESFDRLRSAGVVVGHTPEDARPRCRLYASYLRRHLK
jgi:hypothetical protein